MNKERLLKLAEVLEQPKLPGGIKFDFSTWLAKTECGTAACAIGLCPEIWPDDWKVFHGLPQFESADSPLKGAEEWFDLSPREALYLFVGGRGPWNKRHLNRDSSAKTVAAAIRRFVAWKTVAAAIRRFVAWKEAGNE